MCVIRIQKKKKDPVPNFCEQSVSFIKSLSQSLSLLLSYFLSKKLNQSVTVVYLFLILAYIFLKYNTSWYDELIFNMISLENVAKIY